VNEDGEIRKTVKPEPKLENLTLAHSGAGNSRAPADERQNPEQGMRINPFCTCWV